MEKSCGCPIGHATLTSIQNPQAPSLNYGKILRMSSGHATLTQIQNPKLIDIRANKKERIKNFVESKYERENGSSKRG